MNDGFFDSSIFIIQEGSMRKKLSVLLTTALLATALAAGSFSAYADNAAVEEAEEEVAEAVLTDLAIRDATLKPIFEGFDPETDEYAVTVQSDIYGVLVSPEAPKGTKITVTADKEAKAYNGDVNYAAGDEIEYNEELGGYVVQLGQAYEDYDSEFVQTVTITAGEGEITKDYTVVITRECDADTYALFEEKEFTDEAGTTIPYLIYVPTNYDESKEYPVVFALHGSGQREQPLDMLLKRYQMATIWAKDSEAGHNECIVLAPQCTVEDANIENWTSLMANRAGEADDPFAPMPQLDAAYELLLQVLDEYSCDKDRVYMHGLSAGGYATFTLAQMYPETFAAIAPDASGADPSKVAALKGIPMWIFQAADDPTVPVDDNYYPTIKAMDAAGVDYKKTVYKNGDVFFPSAHFSWVPMYADEEFRDWMFEQTNHVLTEEDAVLTGLGVKDATLKPIFEGFDPETDEYAVTVQSDIYGVLVSPIAPFGAKVTVTADTDAKAYGGDISYTAGDEIPYNEFYGGYVVQLGQAYEDYDSEFVQTATIKVEAADASKEYKVVITRECDKEIYDKFTVETLNYTPEDGEAFDIDYNFYEPVYDSDEEKVPVVLVLHGGGQSYIPETGQQPVDMILKRYQMATIWAKDSEADPAKHAIVIAPHLNKAIANDWGGYTTADPSVAGEAAYAIVQKVLEENPHADADRVYVLGASMGGAGSYAFVHKYADVFAGAIVNCGRITNEGDPAGVDYDFNNLKPVSGHLTVAHAKDDPTSNFSNFEKATAGLKDAGIEHEEIIYPTRAFIYPSGHFSWVPTFANEEVRNWLFEQTK